MSILVISEILGLFVYILTGDDEYSPLNRENWPQPIQIRLSQKRLFFHFFVPFLKSRSVSEHFWKKKMIPIAYVFPNYGLGKTWLDECLKSPVSEHPSTVIILKGTKRRSLRDNSFMSF